MVAAGRYDYIIVGGGTAGCVLANRLSQDPKVRVVLLEAGASDGPAIMSSPNPAAALSLRGSAVDWAYATIPQAGTGGAVHRWPRGRVLGGSSSINAMMHVRGHRSGYDAWAAQGATGWDHDSLLPFFQRSERTHGRDPLVRGTAGPMRIEDEPPADALALACFQAAVEAGYAASPDGNGFQAEGVSWGETNVVAGQRQSAADAYLRPVVSRRNLTVITDAPARRLLLDGSHCHGVEYATAAGPRVAHADREVVLSAGAIGSPQLLMLSGIGPAAHLAEVGVEARANVPGVGQNLRDHILTWVAYTAAQPMSGAPSRQARLLSRSNGDADPDLEMRFAPAALRPRWSGARPDGYSIFVALVSPASRGSLRLRSADPAAAPLLDPGYLIDERDVDRLVTGLRRALAIAGADALAPWRGDELLPGPGPRDDQACRDYIRSTAATYFHPAGTCAIGAGPLAVVDPLLRVRGMDGLRVADASVMPSLVSAPLNATVLAIAERAASLLAGASED